MAFGGARAGGIIPLLSISPSERERRHALPHDRRQPGHSGSVYGGGERRRTCPRAVGPGAWCSFGWTASSVPTPNCFGAVSTHRVYR